MKKKEVEVVITTPEKIGPVMRPKLIQWRNIHTELLKNGCISRGREQP